MRAGGDNEKETSAIGCGSVPVSMGIKNLVTIAAFASSIDGR